MSAYNDQFSTGKNFPSYTKQPRFVIIASTPRSGSHMLGHALHSTGCFGFPLEYFQNDNLKEWMRRFETADVRETLSRLINIRTSQNGVFGLKLHYSHLANIGGYNQLETLFPNAHYILITRQDLLGQAVSYSIASQTNSWISSQNTSQTEPEYCYNDIRSRLLRITHDNSKWRYLLNTSNKQFLEITYESIIKSPKDALETIRQATGIETTIAKHPVEHATKKQGNNLNKLWKDRFIEEHKTLNHKIEFPEPSLIECIKIIRKKISGSIFKKR